MTNYLDPTNYGSASQRTREQRALLHEVADSIQFEPGRFDMDRFFDWDMHTDEVDPQYDRNGNVCGTTMCIGGWGAVLSPDIEVTHRYVPPAYPGDTGHVTMDVRLADGTPVDYLVDVGERMGLTYNEAHGLFFDAVEQAGDDPEATVRLLRTLGGADPRPPVTIAEVRRLLPKNSRRKGGDIWEYIKAAISGTTTRSYGFGVMKWAGKAQESIDSGAQWYQAYAYANKAVSQ